MSKAYKIFMEPEDISIRVAYFIECTDEAEDVTPENADDWFDCVLSANDGYRLSSFVEVSEEEAEAHESVLWRVD